MTLRQLFVRVHDRYTASRYIRDLDAFARWLIENEYPARYAQRLVFRVMRSLETSALPPFRKWTGGELDRAFHRVRHRRLYRHARHAFATFLRAVGRLTPPPDNNRHARMLAHYRCYLSDVLGLAPGTISQNLAEVSKLLQCLAEGQSLKHLSFQIIERCVNSRARQLSRSALISTIGYLRTFLRYCFDRRLITKRLDALDRPVHVRGDLPPRALDWRLIQKFLRSIKRTGRTGWRDFMALHLMAHYGLRTGEITRLTLDSINFSASTLLVDQFKTRSWLTLPLMEQTLELLRRYLREGRRPSARRELFLCALPPSRPMTNAAVSQMFKIRARQSGLPIAHASAYCLRHSFAMRLFGRGVGIKAISDLMGHNSLVSTAVYLRLQTDVLRTVALPVPTKLASKRGAA